MELRLGQILVTTGVLTQEQVDQVMAEQDSSGEPFGLICERLFDIEPETIEEAWALQYANLTRRINPEFEAVDTAAVAMVTRRQAWQFRILPLRFDHGELMVATTQHHLRRALRFCTNVIGVPVYLVLAEPEALGRALCRYYPLPGMTPKSIDNDDLERFFRGSPRSLKKAG